MSYDVIMLIIFGVALMIGGITYLITKSKPAKSKKMNNIAKVNDGNDKNTEEAYYKKKKDQSYAKEDIFNFMEFDQVKDNMIIQQNGAKYTAVIKCKGINYNLLSEVEQLAVEEGFMNFLNTLKYPIQLYVQAQSINLKSNIADYKKNMKNIYEEFDEATMEYNSILNSLDSTEEQIQSIEDKRTSILNVLEYGQDIVRYIEKLSGNKNMLQRSFYVLVSYYKSELSSSANFSHEELLDICYSELFTRVQNIISGLSMCSVSASVLKSNDIAELLYSAYNRDDKNIMNVQQALEAGFYRLYSTSEDAITKKNKRLVEALKQEAEYKALAALNKALEEGNVSTQVDAENAFDEESSKRAIELVKAENLPEEVKEKAKNIIVDDYKAAKKERIAKAEEKIKQTNAVLEAMKKQIEVEEDESIKNNDEIIDEQTTEDNINSANDEDDDSIV